MKKILIKRGLEIGVFLILVGLSAYLITLVSSMRAQLYQQQKNVEQIPEELASRAQLAREVEKHRHDISRLEGYLIDKDHLADFIGSLEQESKLRKVTMQVVNIKEETDTAGTEVFVPVHLTIEAFGNPTDLLAYLYRLEHLPYLAYVMDWEVRPVGGAGQGAGIVISPPTNETGKPIAPPALKLDFRLQATFVITISNEIQPS